MRKEVGQLITYNDRKMMETLEIQDNDLDEEKLIRSR